MQQDYYESKLYPLQDKVLRVGEKAGTSFYLTGGTALSRAYLHHRYSDDLDFFLNSDPGFTSEVNKLFNALNAAFGDGLQRLIDTSSFHRWVLIEGDINLKIEMINDVGFRKGKAEPTSLFFNTDTVENIASNKISALNRNEPKDIADILYIEKLYSPSWPEIIEDAKQKDLSVNEIEIASLIGEYNVELLSNVRWIQPPNMEECNELLIRIARKILKGE
jgi:predicted nucleotidyltransferase component of viral defense system